MNTENQLRKIRWKCRRGMLELDVMLERFITHQLNQLTPEQINQFDKLLDEADPELYNWLLGHTKPRDKDSLAMVKYIQSHL